MNNTFIWLLRFCILGLGLIEYRAAMSSDVLLNEIMAFSENDFREGKTDYFQAPVILSSREHDELSTKKPEAFRKVREITRIEGIKLLHEHVASKRYDGDVTALFKEQLTDSDFRQLTQAKGGEGERFSDDAKATIRFLLLSLIQVWSEEEDVRAELRLRVAKTLRRQNIELADIRPKS